MAQTPEGKVKDKAAKLYKKYGAEYDRSVQNGMGQNGRADDIVCRSPDGHFAGVEYKAGSKYQVSALQRIWLQRREACGGSSLVINELNLAMLERWLAKPCCRVNARFGDTQRTENTCVGHEAFVPGHPPRWIDNPRKAKALPTN